MAQPIRFIHYTNKCGAYETLTLHVTTDDDHSPSRVLTFTWQRTIKEEDRGWYAFHTQIDAQDDRQLDNAIALLRRIRGKGAVDFHFHLAPTDMADRLSVVRATECVYDGRESEWIELNKVAPASEKPYRDDWHAMGLSSCTVGCLAPNEKEAKKRIMLEFARLCTESPWGDYEDRFSQWLTAGQPVRCIADSWGNSAPDVTPLARRVATPETVKAAAD